MWSIDHPWKDLRIPLNYKHKTCWKQPKCLGILVTRWGNDNEHCAAFLQFIVYNINKLLENLVCLKSSSRQAYRARQNNNAISCLHSQCVCRLQGQFLCTIDSFVYHKRKKKVSLPHFYSYSSRCGTGLVNICIILECMIYLLSNYPKWNFRLFLLACWRDDK